MSWGAGVLAAFVAPRNRARRPQGSAEDYLDLAYSRAAFKASHNSYHKAEPLTTQIAWNPTDPSNGGCRGLELDIHRNRELNEWSVSHTGGYDAEPAKQLGHYLRLLREWAEVSPDHDPITVHLDIKNAGKVTSGADALDKYIDSHLGSDRLFIPRALLGSSSDLVTQASAGWPTIRQLRGRFLFCLSGNEGWKRRYSQMQLGSRLCFSDLILDADSPPPRANSGSRVFLNLGDFPPLTLKTALRWISERPGFVSRVYNINSAGAWRRVQGQGANIIATDQVRGGGWATVGATPFVPRRVSGA